LAISFAQLFAGTKKNVGDVTSYKVEKSFISYHCIGGEEIRLDIVVNDIVRLRMAPDGKFATSLSVKLGFVKEKLVDVPFTTHYQKR
jgi:hypothetical protein